MTPTLTQRGESRHETCLHGMLSPGERIDGSARTAILVPLCLFALPSPRPPAIDRAWGGLVEFERDCAVCDAHSTGGA